MFCIRCQIKNEDGLFTHHPPAMPLISSSSSSPLPSRSDYQKQSSSGGQISPAILFIIVILAVVFFISGLLHLLVRLLIKHRSSSSLSESNRYRPDMAGSDAFQRQLQQLFHLHDSGLDQAFIDALPVFLYKEITGLKEPFDCAVCLYEFSENDKLRLLPLCNHAFHIDCIDTWLLSNSTCPLCRGTLFTPGLPIENPVFDLEEQREEEGGGGGFTNNAAIGFSIGQKAAERDIVNSRRFFSVRLGKFGNSNGVGDTVEGESSNSNMDARRCYSMGSYQYIVADMDLRVTLCPGTGTVIGSINTMRGRNGQIGSSSSDGDVDEKKINVRSKGESLSVSKIWQWSRKGKIPSSSS